MENNAVITVISTVASDGDKEQMEFVTEGKLVCGTSYRISYSTDDGSGSELTMIRVNAEEAAIYRKGGTDSHMTVRKGERYVGHYDIGVAGMMVGVSGRDIQVDMSENGGRIYLEYAIDINSEHVSVNSVEIKVSPM